MGSNNALIGTWKLVSFELRLQDGTTRHPWGGEVSGQVMYGPDGFMAGSFMKRDRSPFEASDVMAGTPQEFEMAMKSYVGYAGSYSLQGNRVIHHAEVSLFPNWTGTDIERFFEVQGSKLTLSTPPLIFFGGRQGTAVLVWEKRAPHSVSAT
jgi:hypothetical protein